MFHVFGTTTTSITILQASSLAKQQPKLFCLLLYYYYSHYSHNLLFIISIDAFHYLSLYFLHYYSVKPYLLKEFYMISCCFSELSLETVVEVNSSADSRDTTVEHSSDVVSSVLTLGFFFFFKEDKSSNLKHEL